MSKDIVLHPRAEKEFRKLRIEVQKKFRARFKVLSKFGQLNEPEAKKIKGYKNVFELCIRVFGQWRDFYGYINSTLIAIVHFTDKKKQKTEQKTLKLVLKRLNEYE